MLIKFIKPNLSLEYITIFKKTLDICNLEKTVLKQRSSMKLLDESQSFCDGIADYLTENQDFLVVGKRL